MRELALHLLDIAENSISAGATTVQIRVVENTYLDRLSLSIVDNGKGMDTETVTQVTDPFFTSRTTRKVGLGLPLLKEAAEACLGSMQITSIPGSGTTVQVEFQRSHIDRMPLGDLPSTYLTLLVTDPHIRWRFIYQVDDREFDFDSQPIMVALGDLPVTEPQVLAYLRETLAEGVAEVSPQPFPSIQITHTLTD
ncbi:MAG: ATP-binding protein [Anaerolineaceae bacterium]|nr:ATP-binding protein [Anaerolineaceae bacterium]